VFDRARYYSPTQGRFISQDPLGFATGTTNLYNYANSALEEQRNGQ
jgi:RHS repeat-associated protein